MYTLVTSLLVGIISGIILSIKKKNYEYSIIIPFLSFVIALIIIFIFLQVFPKQEIKEKQEIISISFDNNLNGGFILGSGNINETKYYYYYSKSSNGSIKLNKIQADITSIYEDISDSTSPYIELYKILIAKPYNKWIINNPKENYFKANIHLPKGSIIKQIKLN